MTSVRHAVVLSLLAALPARAHRAAPQPRAAARVAPALNALQGANALWALGDIARAPEGSVKAAADAHMAAALSGRDVAPPPLPAALSFSAPAPLAPAAAPEGAAAETARPEPPRTYLLSRPLEQTARLGPVAQALHYILETAMQFLKAALAWQATDSLAAGAGVLAFELVKMPPMITAQSLADLGLRYWRAKLTTLRALADVPGTARIRVLTTGEVEFKGILAVRKENRGLIFLDSAGALPAEIAGFGAPQPVADLSRRRLRLVLEHGGVPERVVWTPTLGRLLSGSKVPRRVAAAWRARLDADQKGKSALERLFDFSQGKSLRLQAHLSDGAGGETPLGTVAFGGAVKDLVGLGRWDRVRALFGGRPRARAIAISDTLVERGGERRVTGLWRRGWRRLTGRLIVRP